MTLTSKQVAEIRAIVEPLGLKLTKPSKRGKAKHGEKFTPYQWGEVSPIYVGPCCPPSRNAMYLEQLPSGEWRMRHVQHSPGATEIAEYFRRIEAGLISHCRALVPAGAAA
jgi:hypothetical protein